MAKGKKTGGGSRKGSENRSTVAAREAFQFAFHGIGGIAALVAWAKKNRTEFYKLYARLIPTETQCYPAQMASRSELSFCRAKRLTHTP